MPPTRRARNLSQAGLDEVSLDELSASLSPRSGSRLTASAPSILQGRQHRLLSNLKAIYTAIASSRLSERDTHRLVMGRSVKSDPLRRRYSPAGSELARQGIKKSEDLNNERLQSKFIKFLRKKKPSIYNRLKEDGLIERLRGGRKSRKKRRKSMISRILGKWKMGGSRRRW